MYLVCADLRCFSGDKEAHEYIISSLKEALLEFVHALKAMQSKFHLSILAITSNGPPKQYDGFSWADH